MSVATILLCIASFALGCAFTVWLLFWGYFKGNK